MTTKKIVYNIMCLKKRPASWSPAGQLSWKHIEKAGIALGLRKCKEIFEKWKGTLNLPFDQPGLPEQQVTINFSAL